jgi:hypothetical protein
MIGGIGWGLVSEVRHRVTKRARARSTLRGILRSEHPEGDQSYVHKEIGSLLPYGTSQRAYRRVRGLA